MIAVASFPTFLRFPLGEAQRTLDRVSRMFRPPMGQGVFTEPMGGVGVAIPWWLSGGIGAANCVAAYQPKGAASLAASYVNLANPGTNDAAPGVAPTLSSGWVFNGSTQYLTTGIVPANGYTLIVQFSGTTGGNAAGVYRAAGGWIYILPAGTANVRYRYGLTAWDVSPSLASGNLAIAGGQAYRNGIAEDTAKAWAGSATAGIVIGALNESPSITNFFNGTIIAAAVYNNTLSAAQVLAVATAMAAL